ncbi:MAG: hypothetical protein ABGZ23_29965 [Fuerstiella sp.]
MAALPPLRHEKRNQRQSAIRLRRVRVTDLFFVVEVHDFDAIAAQPGEVDGWTFLPVESVAAESLAFDTHQRALQQYRKHQRRPDVNTGAGED